jgi:hypothetical protein
MLAAVVREAGPWLEPYTVPEPGPDRFSGVVEDPDRAFVLEAVYEGYLLHYRAPRAFRDMDEDLRLLAGDALFALGLSRLAASGDLHAVAELSDLISLCARAHVEGRPEIADELWSVSPRALSPAGGPGARQCVAELMPPAA